MPHLPSDGIGIEVSGTTMFTPTPWLKPSSLVDIESLRDRIFEKKKRVDCPVCW
jgi:hypothetical protein